MRASHKPGGKLYTWELPGILIDQGNKLNTRNAKMTLNAYFDFWMETFAKSGRKATTCTNYKSYYNTYIKDTIGKKQIAKITKTDCQSL